MVARGVAGIVLLIAPATISAIAVAQEKPATEETNASYMLEFSGDDYVLIPKLRYDGTHPITLEAWVTAHRPNRGARSCVIGNVQHSGLAIHFRGGSWLFHVNDGRPGNYGYVTVGSDEPAELDKPVHVAGVYDGENVSVFINGKRQQRVGRTESAHNSSPHPFMVGADPDGTGEPHQFFNGVIDELRISAVARYTEDFTPSVTFESDKDTVVLYHFDEGEDNFAKDASGNAYHGRVHGANWIKQDDKRLPAEASKQPEE